MTTLVAPPTSRSPWQRLYEAAHGLRRGWYRSRARRLPRPTISLGNLHWGGTGKTPLTAAVATHLRDRERNVAILSRGYGRSSRGIQLVSSGDGPLLGVEDAGDEPVLLARELAGVRVVVGRNRHGAGSWALETLRPPPDVFLLDDGFSHLKLARDLDVLVFPACDPFAGGRLPPSGRLREPLAAARHADAVVLTSGDENAAAEEGAQLARALRPYGFKGPGFVARLEAQTASTAGTGMATSRPLLLVTGIARPERAVRTARSLALDVVEHLAFPDHHPYPDSSLDKIHRVASQRGATGVVTTSKDAVKLQDRLEVPLVELRVKTVPETAFWAWLDGALRDLEGRS